jgi:hypothetical protein
MTALMMFAFAHDLDTDKTRIEVDGVRLNRVHSERVVDASPEAVWAELSDYANVHQISASIVDSGLTDESTTELGLGCERYCALEFQGRDIYIEETIVSFNEGQNYTYEVTDWENYPLKKMFVTFGVDVNDAGETVVYNIVDYRLAPPLMTGLMKGAMTQSTLTSVLAYKHVTETGETGMDPDVLVDLYTE